MKKFLLSLAVMALTLGGASASDTVATLTFSQNNKNQTSTSSYTSTWTTIVDGYEYSITGCNNNNNGWDYIKCGSKNGESTAKVVNATAFSANIDEIIISCKSNTKENPKLNSATVYVLNAATDKPDDAIAEYDFTESWNAISNTQVDVKIAISNPLANKHYAIVFDMPKYTANGAYWIYSVKYNGTGGVELKDPEVKFPSDAYTAEVGKDFESPVATTLSSGAITYESSESDVASVDANTGVVTVKFAGTTVITAKVAGDAEYKAGDASYTLTVIDPSAFYTSALGEDFSFENVSEFAAWQHDNTYGLKASGYSGGSCKQSDCYAVSPVIDLSVATKASFSFDQALNNFKVSGKNIPYADAVKYCYVAVREENNTTWTDLGNVTAASGATNWNFYTNDPIDLTAYAGKKIQVAFRYTSETTCAGTWEVKNILVRVEKAGSDAVENIELDNEEAPVYYNLQGVRVANPDKGVYIVVKGGKSSKVAF